MTLTYGFYNSVDGDRVYSAIEFSALFDGVFLDGVFESIGNALAVTQDTGSNMNILVGTGRAWFNRTWTNNSSSLQLTVSASDPVYPRIDSVILEVDESDGVRANSIKILTGTPAASPVQPTLTNTSTVHQYRLANIAVAATTTAIVNANITNLIGTTNTPYAKGIIMSTMEDEIQAIYDAIDTLATADAAYRNMLINGDMPVAQRGSSETGVTGGGFKKAPDRWELSLTTMGTWSVSQDTTDAPKNQGFGYAYKLACTTADASPAAGDSVRLMQSIEGRSCQKLKKGTSNAEDVTLSFWIKSSKTGNFVVELYDADNSRHICALVTINSANTDEYKTITFPGDTSGALDNDSNGSLYVEFWFGAGSNYTSGTLATSWAVYSSGNRAVGCGNWADSTANNIIITGIQLEVGDAATKFEHIPFADQLKRCERYYVNSFPYGTTPADGVSRTVDYSGLALTASTLRYTHFLEVPMRIIPTCTFYRSSDGTSAGLPAWFNGTYSDASAVIEQGRSRRVLNFSATVSGATAGYSYLVSGHWVADAEI